MRSTVANRLTMLVLWPLILPLTVLNFYWVLASAKGDRRFLAANNITAEDLPCPGPFTVGKGIAKDIVDHILGRLSYVEMEDHMTGAKTYTVSFEVEELPEDGRCVYNHEFTGTPDLPGYVVRNYDGAISLATCPGHLVQVLRHWDEVAESGT